jgi:hypothetical protein
MPVADLWNGRFWDFRAKRPGQVGACSRPLKPSQSDGQQRRGPLLTTKVRGRRWHYVLRQGSRLKARCRFSPG